MGLYSWRPLVPPSLRCLYKGPRRGRTGKLTKSLNFALYFLSKAPFLIIHAIRNMGPRGFLSDWNSPEWVLSRKACEADDTTLMDEAISMTAAEDLKEFYSHASLIATKNNATAILNNLIERGVRVTPRWPSNAIDASKGTLELLLAQGWDINERGGSVNRRADEPFMWYVASNDDLVKWCLEHGASVHPRGQEPLTADVITQSQRECPQILEKVAAWGSVATFDSCALKARPWAGARCILPSRLLRTSVLSKQETTDDMLSVWLWCATSSTSLAST